jgi:ubiquinone/menaquinone biosynthesis C-methylase UbiE
VSAAPRRPAVEQFGRTADLYARSQGRRYPEETVLRLADPQRDDRYLDVGTGPGTLVRIIGPGVAFAVGADLTREMLARFESGDSRAAAVRADACRLPFADGAFTLVTCGSVFHHLEKPEEAAAEVARVLAAGGRFLLVDMAGPEEPDRRAARDEVESVRDPSHVAILQPSRARAMLEAAGFELVDETPQVDEVRDDVWCRLGDADVEAVRGALRRHESVDAGFVSLRREGEGFVMLRERRYYLGVKRAGGSGRRAVTLKP